MTTKSFYEYLYDPIKNQYLKVNWKNLVQIENIQYVPCASMASEFSDSRFAKYVCLCYARWKLGKQIRFKRFMYVSMCVDANS